MEARHPDCRARNLAAERAVVAGSGNRRGITELQTFSSASQVGTLGASQDLADVRLRHGEEQADRELPGRPDLLGQTGMRKLSRRRRRKK